MMAWATHKSRISRSKGERLKVVQRWSRAGGSLMAAPVASRALCKSGAGSGGWFWR